MPRSLDFFLLIYTTILLITSCNYAKKSTKNPIEIAKQMLPSQGTRIQTLLFVPRDPIEDIIVGLIKCEKKSILMAQYRLNNRHVVDALIEAKGRGVFIEIIADQSAYFDTYNKTADLLAHKISIDWYKGIFSIMHHKMFIFGNNFFKGPLIIIGSANMSMRGYKSNRESVGFFNDPKMIAAGLKEFNRLKEECVKEIPTKEVLILNTATHPSLSTKPAAKKEGKKIPLNPTKQLVTVATRLK